MSMDRSILSPTDRKSRSVRIWFFVMTLGIGVFLVISGLAPLAWLLKASLSTSQDILRDPLALFPQSGLHFENFALAWTKASVGVAIWNSIALALGVIVVNVVIAISLSYVLSVLRPRWAGVLEGAILATLFIPGVVALVPLYLTVLNVPGFNVNLLNTYWAVWLPSAASAFNVLVVKRFFDGIPRELFEAARVDGAGPWRVLWSIVLPLSKPIIGVIAIFAGFGAWKDFLWPKLVLPSPDLQPISVSLVNMARNTDLSVQMAALLLALILPLALFIIFQRQFLAGVAMTGGVKE